MISIRHHARALLAIGAAAGVAFLASCDSPTGPGDRTPARVDIVSGDLQAAVVGTELGQPLVVKVVDGKGKPVEGQLVNFRVTAGGGSVFGGSAATNNQGEARERWTLGTVAGDTQRVEARAVDASTGEPLVFATFRAVGTADAPAAIEVVGQNHRNGAAGEAVDSLAVRVRDKYGNPVPSTPVLWTVRAGGGTLSPTQDSTGADGVARSRWTLGPRADSVQVAEAAASLTLKTAFTALAAPGIGTAIVRVSGDGQTGTAGTELPQPLVARVVTATGQPIQGALVTWSAGTGTVSPTESRTDADGLASTRWTPAANGARTATAAVYLGPSTTFTASVPDPVQPALTVTSPAEGAQVAGAVRLTARCSGCQSIEAVVGASIYRGASYTVDDASLDSLVSVPGAAGTQVTITFRALRSSGNVATETRTVQIVASGMQTVATVPGTVLAYAAGRVLWYDPAAVAVKVRTVAGGGDQTLATGSLASAGWLTPAGAAFVATPTGGGGSQLYAYHGGTLTSAGAVVGSLARGRGGWVAWKRTGGDVGLLDTGTGTTVFTIHPDSVYDGSFDVGENGDLVWVSADSLMRRRGGSVAVLARGSTDGGWDQAELAATDGTNVLLGRLNAGSRLPALRIPASGTPQALAGLPAVPRAFSLNGGWIALTGVTDTDGRLTRVSPGGAVESIQVRDPSSYAFSTAPAVSPSGAAVVTVYVPAPRNGYTALNFLVTSAGAVSELPAAQASFDGTDLVLISGGTVQVLELP